MSTELNEDAVTTTTDEELELDLNLDDTEGAEQGKTVSESQYRQVLARAKKAESQLRDKKTAKPHITNDEGKQNYNILDDDIADMLLDGYTKDEVKFVIANGGRKALEDKDSFVSVAIETKREQRKAEQAASQTNYGGGSEIERKYTPEQLKEMPLEDLKKILPHA